ncbi:MAG: DUF2520 domain-containing protein [Bacteroidales bacterium]|nr:DUF2520 domain-containing protein [Bacteroidales bacterium]
MAQLTKLNIVVIGSGNVATQLARILFTKGHKILQIYSRTLSNAHVLAKEVDALATSSFQDIHTQADLYIIAITDTAIYEAAKKLSHVNGLVVHTSGTTDMNVLGHLNSHGVFYPLQTFSKFNKMDFRNIPILIEASDTENFDILHNLAESISSNVHAVNSEKRSFLHLAAIFANNFTNHLYFAAQKILFEKELDFDLIRPLIMESALKVMSALPSEVQTGPSVRNDVMTINKHLKMLETQIDLKTIYQLISNNIIKSSLNND